MFDDKDSYSHSGGGDVAASLGLSLERRSTKNSLLGEKDSNKITETRVYEGLWKDEENRGIFVEEIEFSAQSDDKNATLFTLE